MISLSVQRFKIRSHSKIAALASIIALQAGPRLLHAANLTQLANILPVNFELLDIELVGDMAFVPGGLGGLNIIDISDPSRPRVRSIYLAPGCEFGRVYSWHVAGDYGYGSGRECGIKVIDIENIGTPTDAGTYNSSEGSYEHIAGSGNYLFAAVHNLGVEVIDRTNPLNLTHVAWIPTTNAWAVTLSTDGQYLFVADGIAGLQVIDVSNPHSPRQMGSSAASGTAKDIAFSNGYLFVAVGAQGVDMIDVTDPVNPRLVANYNTSGYASRISVSDSLVAVSDWDDVEILKWSDAPDLKLAGFKNSGGRVMAVAMQNGIIFSAEWGWFRTYQYGEIAAGDIDLSSRKIDLPYITPGECITKSVFLDNNGGATLNIGRATIDHADYQFQLPTASVAPGETLELTFAYCASTDHGRASLIIETDDPDEPIVNVKLSGNPRYGLDTGLEAPNFTLSSVNGYPETTLSDFLGRPILLSFFASW